MIFILQESEKEILIKEIEFLSEEFKKLLPGANDQLKVDLLRTVIPSQVKIIEQLKIQIQNEMKDTRRKKANNRRIICSLGELNNIKMRRF
nr:hypothetical protein [Mycobacterium tuberculosis]